MNWLIKLHSNTAHSTTFQLFFVSILRRCFKLSPAITEPTVSVSFLKVKPVWNDLNGYSCHCLGQEMEVQNEISIKYPCCNIRFSLFYLLLQEKANVTFTPRMCRFKSTFFHSQLVLIHLLSCTDVRYTTVCRL